MVGVPPVSLYLSLSLIRSLFLSCLLSPSVCARETYNGRREPTCYAPRVLIVLNFLVLICRLRDAHEKKKCTRRRGGTIRRESVRQRAPMNARVVLAYRHCVRSSTKTQWPSTRDRLHTDALHRWNAVAKSSPRLR